MGVPDPQKLAGDVCNAIVTHGFMKPATRCGSVRVFGHLLCPKHEQQWYHRNGWDWRGSK